MAEAIPKLQDDESITVRMYRGLLGDCFLLSHTCGGRAFNALIDCGVLQCIGNRPKTRAALAKIGDVVADIARRTQNHLQLVIATHEHYDHLSGFQLHFSAFEAMTIDEVWMGWTENEQDEEAAAIRADGRKALSALKWVVDKQKAAFAADAEATGRLDNIENLLTFYDGIEPLTGEDLMGAAAGAKTPPKPYEPKVPPRSCRDVLNWLKGAPPARQRVRYLEPGEVVRFGVDNRLAAHVMGPPRRSDRLLKLNPSSGEAREVYLTRRDDVAALLKMIRVKDPALAADGSATRSRETADHPFAARFHRSPEEQGEDPMAARYAAKGQEARRIDGDWLGSAELLALKIDGDVNNTSLALAVQVPGEARDVLLFPADAQVGNWLSWHDQTYPAKPARPDDPVESAKDLLARVILYKVGHHGSHNATAQQQGLEMMTSPRLVAMIPVVKEVAREQTSKTNPNGWAMPYPQLFERLTTKTRSRILQGDGDVSFEREKFGASPSLFDLHYDGEDTANDKPLWVEVRYPRT